MTPDAISPTATLDWDISKMAANDDSVLSQDYMQQILTGLNGGNPDAPDATQDALIASGSLNKFLIMRNRKLNSF